jgi:hypothetical protein
MAANTNIKSGMILNKTSSTYKLLSEQHVNSNTHITSVNIRKLARCLIFLKLTSTKVIVIIIILKIVYIQCIIIQPRLYLYN